jgi:hypothetical protein
MLGEDSQLSGYHAPVKNLILLSSLPVLVSLCVACGDGAGGAASGSAAASSKPAASAKPSSSTSPATAKPEEKKADAPVEMVDHDLEAGDPKWKGWTAKGPKDAKVLADGVNGARIAGKAAKSMIQRGPGDDTGYDIHFAWGKDDLKATKKAITAEKIPVEGVKVVTTITKEEPGLLEWTDEITTKTETSKTYNFVMHLIVEKSDVSCGNNFMIGAGNEAQHKAHMEGCKSLAKKK